MPQPAASNAAPLSAPQLGQPGPRLLQLHPELLLAVYRELHHHADQQALRSTCKELLYATAGFAALLELTCLDPWRMRVHDGRDPTDIMLQMLWQQLDSFTSPAPLLSVRLTCTREPLYAYCSRGRDTLPARLVPALFSNDARWARVHQLWLKSVLVVCEGDVSAIAAACPHLAYLAVEHSTLRTACLPVLASMQQLRSLSFSDTGVQDVEEDFMAALSLLTQLTALSIVRSSAHTKPDGTHRYGRVTYSAPRDGDVAAIAAACRNLVSVTIEKTHLSGAALRCMASMRQLRSLDLSGLWLPSVDSGSAVSLLTQLTSLRMTAWILLIGNSVELWKHSMLEVVSGLTNLRSLDLGEGMVTKERGQTRNVSWVTASQLAPLTQLTSLRLAFEYSTAVLPCLPTFRLEDVHGLQQLVRLALPGLAVDVPCLTHALQQMPLVRHVEVGQLLTKTEDLSEGQFEGRLSVLSLGYCPSLLALASLSGGPGTNRTLQLRLGEHGKACRHVRWRLVPQQYKADPEGVLQTLERAVQLLASSWCGAGMYVLLTWDYDSKASRCGRPPLIPNSQIEAALAPLKELDPEPIVMVRIRTSAD